MWGDGKFRSLSKPKPNAQTLFVYLLTGPHTGPIPGLFVAGRASLAEGLEWPPAAVSKCFAELEHQAMAFADWPARVVFLPNGMRHNPPDNPNVVRGWRSAFEEIPDCKLRDSAYGAFRVFLSGLSEPFLKPFGEPLPQGLPKQEEEEEEEKEEEKEKEKEEERGGPKFPPVPEALIERVPEMRHWPSVEALIALWNDTARREGLPLVETVSAARTGKTRKYLSEFPDWRFWNGAVSRIKLSRFLTGKIAPTNGHSKAFRADFDWLLATKDGVENVAKLHDGKYDG